MSGERPVCGSCRSVAAYSLAWRTPTGNVVRLTVCGQHLAGMVAVILDRLGRRSATIRPL